MTTADPIMQAQISLPMATGEGTMGGNPWNQWFGTARGEIRTGAYDKLASVTETLPDAYKGRNLFLRDSIDGFIFDNNEMYTSILLPWAYTPELTVTWNEWNFNRTLAGRVPPEGISRLVTAGNKSGADHLVSRGLAFMLEHGFWKTSKGRERYRRNVVGIKQCVQETLNFDVLNSLHHAGDYDKQWEREHGVPAAMSPKKMLENEVQHHVITQKYGPTGLEMLLDKMITRMQRYRAVANVLVAHPDFRIYYNNAHPERTQYWIFGPDGVMNLKEGPMAVTRIRDAYVLETRLLDVHENAPPIDLLKIDSEVGEHYFLGDQNAGSDHKNFKTSQCDTLIYKEPDADTFVRISFREAFKYVTRFNKQTKVLSAAHDKVIESGTFKSDPTDGYYGTNYQKDALNIPVTDMFLFRTKDSVLKKVYRFGQMELNYFDDHDVSELAIMMVVKMFGETYRHALTHIDNYISIATQSANVPYHARFTQMLLDKNRDRQMANGVIRGQSTSSEFAELNNGAPRIPECVPNRHGGLDIPARTAAQPLEDLSVPPYCTSWPMILSLADHAMDKDSGWYEIAKKARDSTEVIKCMSKHIREMLPTCPALKPLYRSPWFQMCDANATLSEELILSPADGVFLNFTKSAPSTVVKSRIGSNVGKSPAKIGALPDLKAAGILTDREILRLTLIGSADEDRAILDNLTAIADDMLGKGADDREDEFITLMNAINGVRSAYYNRASKSSKTQPSYATARAVARKVFNYLVKLYWDEATYPTYTLEVGQLAYLFPHRPNTTAVEKKAGLKVLDDILKRDKTPLEVLKDGDASSEAAKKNAFAKSDEKNYYLAGQKKSTLMRIIQELKNGHVIPEEVDVNNDTASALTELEKAAATNAQAASAIQYLTDIYVLAGLKADQNLSDMNESFNEDLTPENLFSTKGEISKEAWDSGTWLRAPISSSKMFVESLLFHDRPLALPSDPSAGHLKPVGVRRGIDPNDITDLLARAEYIQRDVGTGNTSDRPLQNSVFLKSMLKIKASSAAYYIQGRGRTPRATESEEMETERTESPTIGRGIPPSQSNKLLKMLITDDTPAIGARSEFDDDPMDTGDARKPRGYAEEESRVGPDEDPGCNGFPPSQVGKKRRPFENVDLEKSKLWFESHSENFVMRYSKANSITDSLVRIIAQAFLLSENTEKQWDALLENDIMVPGKIQAFRPWITHEKYTLLFMRGGYETGATFYGHSDVLLGDDVVSKVHYANYTFWSKAIVVVRKNIMSIPDAFSAGYVRGCSTEPIKTPASLDQENAKHSGDIIFVLLPYREGLDRPSINPMDIRGAFAWGNEPGTIPHYSSASYTNEVWRFQDRIGQRAQFSKTFHNNYRTQNTVTFWGHQITYNRSTGMFDQHHLNTGHWGIYGQGNGAAAVRSGNVGAFEKQDWSRYKYPA